MFLLYRTTLPALCLSLILPCTAQALAGETPEAPEQAPAKQVQRHALAERSLEDAQALERQVPKDEQQTLQAGSEAFLALWKPANTPNPEGALIIVPGAGETADWPKGVGPLRRKFPDVQWSTLSLSLPDLQADAPIARTPAPAPAPAKAPADDSKAAPAKDTPADANANIAQATAAETENTDSNEPATEPGADDKADAERIFARIEAGIAYAQQQNARSIVLLGHGSGAYWAARFLSERQPAQVQKLVMVSGQTPARVDSTLESLTPTLKLPTADFYYATLPQVRRAAEQRLQASKRLKDSSYRQVALNALPNQAAEQEQLFRRIRGWLSPTPSN